MKKELGLWIDHKEAVIAFVVPATAEPVAVKRIGSDMEKHVRFSGGASAVMEEDMRDRRFTNHLNQFFHHVSNYVRNADSILIFGPGEAKGELVKRLEGENLHGRIVGIETVDKMTDGQIAARVRERFAHPV